MTETTLLHNDAPLLAAASGFDVDLTPCDVKVGELYAVMVPDHDAALILEFKKRLSNGILCFVKPGTDQVVHFPRSKRAALHVLRAVRIDLSNGLTSESSVVLVNDGGAIL